MNSVLKDVAVYSNSRISLDEINVETYVTTDNLLQNKQGKVNAEKMPKQVSNTVTRFDKGDILVANIRPYLKKIWLADYAGGSSTDVLTFRVKEGYDSAFVYYALFRDDFFAHMMNGSKGTKMPRGDKNQILDFTIPNFDIIYQKQIAEILSNLDANIDLNNKINAELKAMSKLIYDYWFVQFDFPDKNGKPYKSSGGLMVYNEDLKKEIPECWESGTINDIAELVRGVSYNKHNIKSSEDENVTPILRATNIKGSTIDLDNMVFVPNSFVSDNQVLNTFEVLITMSSGSKNHIGKNGMFYFDKKVAFGAFCAKLVSKENFRYFLFSYTQSDFMSATIKNECLGTNINNLNGSLVKGFKLVLPNKECLELFNKKVAPVYNKIANNHKENQKLTELRDWLLPLLMNKQVRVGEV